MSLYNTFKYGDGTKYGATPSDELPGLLWTFIVDWDGDGYYTGENEATRMTSLSVSRGRDNLVKANGKGWERYKPGTATVIVDNSDGRYDPWNTSSPLYPNVTPGKFVRIKAKDVSDGSNYNVMHGIISNIQPYNKGGIRKAIISVTDGLQWLRDRKVRMGLRQNDTFGGAINHIVRTLTDFPTDQWPVSNPNNGHTFDKAWSWDFDALTAIEHLCDFEAGQFLHDRFGNITWFYRNYTHSGSLTISEEELLRDIQIPQPWDVVRNSIILTSYERFTFNVNTTLWELGDNTFIPSGGEVNFDVRFEYTPSTHVVGDICGANVSYSLEVNANEGGGGTDLTGGCSVLVNNNEIGPGMEIIVRNGGPTDGYIQELIATGDVIYAPYATTVRFEDSTSKALYGTRTMEIDNKWLTGPTDNIDYAEWVLSQLKDPKKFPIVQIEDRPSIQFSRDIFRDRIQFTSPTLGITGDFRIGKIEHNWVKENGSATRTVWKLEPYLTSF